MDTNHLLLPLVSLCAWTMVMWCWMYATRIPAIFKMRLRLDSRAPNGEQMAQLPPEVRWKADNYNHLFEQPVLFYATVFTIVSSGHGTYLDADLAWAYVALRMVHSFVQSLGNHIKARFGVFVLGSFVLMVLIARAVMYVL